MRNFSTGHDRRCPMDTGPGIIGQFVSGELIGISFFVEIENPRSSSIEECAFK